ncbi:unnamed protein product [Ixodes pacificus]
MASPLTGGAVERILNGETVDKPVLQVLNFKPIAGNTTDRYRLLLSDGVKCHTCECHSRGNLIFLLQSCFSCCPFF